MSNGKRWKDTYSIDGEEVTITGSLNHRKGTITVLTGPVETPDELDRTVEALTQEARLWSAWPEDKLRANIELGEVPHAQVLLKFGETPRIGFDLDKNGDLGFFIQHHQVLEPEAMLEMLTAPGHHMSEDDRQKAAEIKASLGID